MEVRSREVQSRKQVIQTFRTISVIYALLFASRSKIETCSFMPYGYGPRICLGMNLATVEACRLLSEVIKRYKIRFCDDSPDPLPIGCAVPELIRPIGPVNLEFQLIEEP